jgi:hypothetical protein
VIAVAEKSNPYVGKIGQGASQNIKPSMQKTDTTRAVKTYRGKDLRTGKSK